MQGMSATGKSIGDIVEVYCTRCRLNLDASVSALIDGAVVKVTCRTCGNEVKYREPVDLVARKKQQLDRLLARRARQRAGHLAPKAAPAADAGLAPAAQLRKLWDDLTDKVDARRARVYDPTATYSVEQALLHKKFGMGIVHSVDGDGMLRVLFRDGFEELESGREPDLDD